MNITSGTPMEKGASLGDIRPKEYIAKMMEEKFNGYVCITVRGKTGIEEGVMLFHNGSIVSCDYEYYKYNARFVAEEALARSMNAFTAPRGVLDSFSLSPYQIQLVMTLNEDCNLKTDIITPSMLQFPEAFSYSFEESLAGPVKKPEKGAEKDVLMKRYGLSRMLGPNVTRSILMESADEENKRIDKMMDKKGKK